MVAIKPVDFRKGAAGLAVLVRAKMAADRFYDTLYVFRGKQAHRENRSGAGARLQICRSPTDVPVAPVLRPGGHRSRPFDAGRSGPVPLAAAADAWSACLDAEGLKAFELS